MVVWYAQLGESMHYRVSILKFMDCKSLIKIYKNK